MEIVHVDNALTYSGAKNPFNVLFYATSEEHDISTIDAKVKFITAIIRSIEVIENKVENEGNLNNWLRIASGISGTAIVISTASLNPFTAIATTFFGVASALVTIGSTIYKGNKEAPVINNLLRYKCCLKSADVSNWAIIWHLTGTVPFLDALYEGATGQIFENKLIRPKQEPSLNAVINYVASCGGVTPQELIVELKKIKEGRKPSLRLVSSTSEASLAEEVKPAVGEVAPASNPTVSPTTKVNYDELKKVATAIRDSLITNASASKLPGCVILGAPGAGKTTFLGSAWLKLKQEYGNKFQSLALVMKSKDVKTFEPIANRVISAKKNPKRAAKELVKFVDEIMEVSDNVSRLFLDDFLAMQELFDKALGGTVIDLETYAIYVNQKEASEMGCDDAISLKAAVAMRLKELWTVGREFNSALWVSSHSPNVKDLAFCGSASARSVGSFVILVKNDNREFIELALKNDDLINNENSRVNLKRILKGLDVKTDEPLVLGNHNNWCLGVVSQTIRDEYETLEASTKQTVIQSSVKDTVVQARQETLLQEDDIAIAPNSSDLNKDLKAARLGIGKEALMVFEKLKSFEQGAKVRDLVHSKPFGKIKTPTSKIKYYLDELVIAELVIKTEDGSTEVYSCVEP